MHLWTFFYLRFMCHTVGCDLYGNTYYQEKKVNKKRSVNGMPRRFVWYKGQPEPSKIPSGWHAWLHYISCEHPKAMADQQQTFKGTELSMIHQPNLTGTAFAHSPLKDAYQDDQLRLLPYQRWEPKD